MKFWHSSETSEGIIGLSLSAILRYRAKRTLLSLSRRSPQGFFPVSISIMRQPSDHMSDLYPNFWVWVSGAIHAGELATREWTLNRLRVLAELSLVYPDTFSFLRGIAGFIIELPISHNLISLPSWLTRTLAPFKSPWITFISCIYTRARRICYVYFLTMDSPRCPPKFLYILSMLP